jgi:hypothetical protein
MTYIIRDKFEYTILGQNRHDELHFRSRVVVNQRKTSSMRFEKLVACFEQWPCWMDVVQWRWRHVEFFLNICGVPGSVISLPGVNETCLLLRLSIRNVSTSAAAVSNVSLLR